MVKSSLRPRTAAVAVFALASLSGQAASVSASDLIVFAASATPTEVWGSGYGGALSLTFFKVVSFEAEAARLSGEAPDTDMISFTGSALLGPPLGAFVPYGGLGVGVFRQGAAGRSDTGALKAFVLGVKVKLAIVVLKGEYRRIDLSGEPIFPIEHRFSFGGGISF
jgi:hypothetical protein